MLMLVLVVAGKVGEAAAEFETLGPSAFPKRGWRLLRLGRRRWKQSKDDGYRDSESNASRSSANPRKLQSKRSISTCRSPKIQGHIKLTTSIICGERDDVKRTLTRALF